MRAEILVTGGSGLLGNAVQKLLPGAFFADSKVCDLRDVGAVERLFETRRPAKVLHLAAVVGGVKSNAERNAEMFAQNVLINTNVLSTAQKHKVSRLVSVLSTCTFPPSDRPCNEKDLHSGMPYEGNAGYGYSKRMLDVQTRLIAKDSGLRFSTVTPVTMFGPHDDWDPENGHVISALIRKCVAAKEEKSEFSVWGSGEAVRQFVYCEDVARVLVQELERFDGPGTMIVAPDRGITIQALAHRIAETVGFGGKIHFDRSKPEGQRVKVVESLCFGNRYPGFSFTPLEEGFRRTVAWFLEHRDAAEAHALVKK